jgi:hypothetical protein
MSTGGREDVPQAVGCCVMGASGIYCPVFQGLNMCTLGNPFAGSRHTWPPMAVCCNLHPLNGELIRGIVTYACVVVVAGISGFILGVEVPTGLGL